MLLSVASGSYGLRGIFELGALTTSSTARRCRFYIADDGGTLQLVIQQGTSGAAGHNLSRASITSSSMYVWYIEFAGSGIGIQQALWNDTAGSLVFDNDTGADWDDGFGSSANSTANGKVGLGASLITSGGGGITTSSAVGKIDGIGIYTSRKTTTARFSNPDSDTTDRAWYIPFSNGSLNEPNEVGSATAIDSANNVTWNSSDGTWTGAGASGISGSAALAMPMPQVALAGVVPIQGSMALGSFAAEGDVPRTGDLAIAVPLPVFAAEGDVPRSGDLAIEVPLVQLTAEGGGVALAQGDLAIAMPLPVFAAEADVLVGGQLTLGVPLLIFAGTGAVHIQGTLTLGMPLVRFAGESLPPGGGAAVPGGLLRDLLSLTTLTTVRR
jgi:hypothetical protein